MPGPGSQPAHASSLDVMSSCPVPRWFAPALAAWLAVAVWGGPALAANDFSPAERALFMTNQLASLKPPITLRYSYRRSGSLEPAFDDAVAVKLRAQPGGGCCIASAEFLSGPRRLSLPEVEGGAEGNPAILYFLERDIREMNRLTKGQANYFRKRIRMAVYRGAAIEELNVSYQGKPVAARRIVITPYADDPLRVRFEKLANKTYTFTLSEAVPGGVYSMHSRIDTGTAGAAPLIAEEMLIDGGETLR
jgi:hypothetical protein